MLTNEVIELWRVSNSTLARSITSGATRDIKWVDLSNTFVATLERFGYGSGGFLRVHNISTGALVKSVLAIRNSSPQVVKFSPNGQYLVYPDHYSVNGMIILKTSDWTTALAVAGTTAWGWAPDSGSLWTSNDQRRRIPDGAVLQTVPDHPDKITNAYTPNNQFFLTSVMVNANYSNTLEFLRTSDATVRLNYTFSNGTIVYGGLVGSNGGQFTYSICPSDCTLYVATLPAL